MHSWFELRWVDELYTLVGEEIGPWLKSLRMASQDMLSKRTRRCLRRLEPFVHLFPVDHPVTGKPPMQADTCHREYCQVCNLTHCKACKLSLFFQNPKAVRALEIVAKGRKKHHCPWNVACVWLDPIPGPVWERRWKREAGSVLKDRSTVSKLVRHLERTCGKDEEQVRVELFEESSGQADDRRLSKETLATVVEPWQEVLAKKWAHLEDCDEKSTTKTGSAKSTISGIADDSTLKQSVNTTEVKKEVDGDQVSVIPSFRPMTPSPLGSPCQPLSEFSFDEHCTPEMPLSHPSQAGEGRPISSCSTAAGAISNWEGSILAESQLQRPPSHLWIPAGSKLRNLPSLTLGQIGEAYGDPFNDAATFFDDESDDDDDDDDDGENPESPRRPASDMAGSYVNLVGNLPPSRSNLALPLDRRNMVALGDGKPSVRSRSIISTYDAESCYSRQPALLRASSQRAEGRYSSATSKHKPVTSPTQSTLTNSDAESRYSFDKTPSEAPARRAVSSRSSLSAKRTTVASPTQSAFTNFDAESRSSFEQTPSRVPLWRAESSRSSSIVKWKPVASIAASSGLAAHYQSLRCH